MASYPQLLKCIVSSSTASQVASGHQNPTVGMSSCSSETIPIRKPCSLNTSQQPSLTQKLTPDLPSPMPHHKKCRRHVGK